MRSLSRPTSRRLLVASLLLVRCSADPATRAPPASDVADASHCSIASLVDDWTQRPPPPAPGLAGYAVTADDRIDLDPLARGAHAGLALAPGPTCTALATPLTPLDESASPEPTATTAPAAPSALGADADDPTLRALVVASTDPARDPAALTDLAHWDTILRTLGARGHLLRAPTRATLAAALATECASLAPAGGTFLLATIGPGARTPSGEGGFLADHAVLPWRELAAQVRSSCARARLVVWVVDSSYSEDLRRPVASPPLVILAASDKQSPDAPRASSRGPGALTTALAEHLPAAYAASCPRGVRDPGSLALTLVDLARTLRDAMVALRWQTTGAPALASLPPARRDTAQPLLADFLARGVPSDLIYLAGTLPAPARCTEDSDCTCTAAPCERFACERGRCREAFDTGATCDDQNRCTIDDHCDPIGRCTGDLLACDDGNACTRDDCDPHTGCTTTPAAGGPCDDRDPCTVDDTCHTDASCRGTARDCDDGDPCTRDSCDPTQSAPTAGNPRAPCIATRGNFACDDGDACTRGDQCQAGVCLGVRAPCDDGNPCTADGCDAATGTCHATSLPDGATCDDGDACTTLDRCHVEPALGGASNVRCEGLAATCDDGLACTIDRCRAGACESLPAPGTCLVREGCIPVGAHPADAPCQICVATGHLALDPSREGAPCDDDGIACTHDLCEAGVCRHRDAPGECHRPDGTCVPIGAPLTACLTCIGGGVAAPVPAGVPCGGPDACAYGTCDGRGACVLPDDPPCCQAEALTCGATRVLTASDVADLTSRIDAWTCNVLTTPGPERHLRVTAACAGTLHVALAGPPGALLVGGVDPCPAARCTSADPSELSVELALGEHLDVAVELPPGLENGEDPARFWVVTTRCDCDPAPPPPAP